MAIFKKQLRNRYTTIPNELIDRPDLSAKAKGILMYLLSKPDTWKPRVMDIVNHMKEGEKAISSGIKELRELGYMKLIFQKGEAGRFEGSDWLVSDYPAFSGTPKTGDPQNRGLRKSGTIKDSSIVSTDKSNTTYTPPEKKEAKTLMANSGITEEAWEEKFKQEHLLKVDVLHYYHAVLNYSDKKTIKTTLRGWWAYGRDFMRRDKKAGKLVMLEEQKNMDDALEYLREQ